MLVDAEFFGGVARACAVCGRVLDNDISRASGIGPICAGKMGLPRPTRENANEILKQLEEKTKNMAPIERKWIPKSQMKIIEEKS